MPGNYNKGDEYTVDEQVPFATFVACRLDTAGNPFAINADKHFYDREHHMWRSDRSQVLEVVLHPDCEP